MKPKVSGRSTRTRLEDTAFVALLKTCRIQNHQVRFGEGVMAWKAAHGMCAGSGPQARAATQRLRAPSRTGPCEVRIPPPIPLPVAPIVSLPLLLKKASLVRCALALYGIPYGRASPCPAVSYTALQRPRPCLCNHYRWSTTGTVRFGTHKNPTILASVIFSRGCNRKRLSTETTVLPVRHAPAREDGEVRQGGRQCPPQQHDVQIVRQPQSLYGSKGHRFGCNEDRTVAYGSPGMRATLSVQSLFVCCWRQPPSGSLCGWQWFQAWVQYHPVVRLR